MDILLVSSCAVRVESEPDIKRKLGSAIRTLRLEIGKSQEELAFDAQISVTYLSDVERGKRNPAIINICRIAASLQINASQLLERAGL